MKTSARISFLTATLVVLLVLVLSRDILLILAGAGWSPAARALSLLLIVVTAFGVIQFTNYADHLLRSLYVYPEHPLAPRQETAPPADRKSVV